MLICSALAAGEFGAKIPGREVDEISQNARVVLQSFGRLNLKLLKFFS